MYNFDSYNVLLVIATNIAVLLMTAFVLQGHIFNYIIVQLFIYIKICPSAYIQYIHVKQLKLCNKSQLLDYLYRFKMYILVQL